MGWKKKIWLCVAILGVLSACGNDAIVIFPDPTPYELDVPFYFGDYQIPHDNPMTNEGVELGRRLFFESKLSADNTMSCASCHQPENGFSSNLRFDPGIEGASVDKNTLQLVNLLWFNRFFWDGRGESLEEISLNALENPLELNQPVEAAIIKIEESGSYAELFARAFGTPEINRTRMEKALAQFLRTLISADSKYDKFLRGEEELTGQETLGLELFFTHPDPEAGIRGGNCGDCHSNFLTSGFNTAFDGFHNNGLDLDVNLSMGLKAVTGKESDRGKFVTPSLRNIARTFPYMHDGRFNTLEEVLDHYNENIQPSSTLDVLILEASNEPIAPDANIKLRLTDQEKDAIIAFLLTLTDHSFISNENFKDPSK